MIDWGPFWLTGKLALLTTLLLVLLGIPLSYWLAYTKAKIKPVVETVVSLPLVLPPTVLGFYLLQTFSPTNPFGAWLKELFNVQLIFTFEGLVIASIIYSLPFMVQPIYSGLTHLPISLKEAAYCLGKSRSTTLLHVLLPNIKTSILTGIVLTFAHTIGEFGVVLMIGGNIPNTTKVASIAVYDEVEALNYASANTYSIVLLAITFSILLLVYTINGGYLKRKVL